MRNNPEANIRTDFAIDSVVKPNNMNALAASIQYDYVVTPKMIQDAIDEGATEIDVDALLGGDKISGRTGEYHILINSNIDPEYTLLFDGSGTGESSGTLDIHVYALGNYTASVSGTDSNVTFYFHTFGEKGAVTLSGIGANTYVGSFYMEDPVEAASGSTFVYEMALGALPTADAPDSITLLKKAWLSNTIGGSDSGSRAIVTLLHYKRIGPMFPGGSGFPYEEWPLYAHWKSDSGETGVIAATEIFPSGTAPGVKTGTCLVPRAKAVYDGALLPGSLMVGRGALLFRNALGNWSPNIYRYPDESSGTLYSFVLSDSFLGCVPEPSFYDANSPVSHIKINNKTTQMDMFMTLGLVYDDTGATLPAEAGRSNELYFHVDDMEEGQVIEMNMHIVELPPAKQSMHSSLGLEHFIGDWDASTEYSDGDFVSVLDTGDKWNFYRSLENHNTGNDPATSPESWESVSGGTDDDMGRLHAATPLNSGVRPRLQFIVGTDSINLLSWGYGTSGLGIQGGDIVAPQSTYAHVTFSVPQNTGYQSSPFTSGAPTIPIAASAKVIFTKVITEDGPVIVILTGGYCCPSYPNY